MPEWILKLVTAVTSVKTALKLFVFVLLLVFFWSFTSAFMASKGLPSEYIPYILMLTAYSLSHLSIELLYWLKSWNKRRQDKNEESLQQEQAQEVAKKEAQSKVLAFRREVESTLPHLNRTEFSLLKKMLTESISLERNRDPALHFHNIGYISVIGRKSFRENVYELHPIVRDCLTNYLAEERKNTLIAFSSALKDKEKEFLRIFFEKEIPFGVPEQEEMMPANVYSGKYSMVNLGIIDEEGYSFILPEDTKERLIEDNHFEVCYRNLAELDGHLILSPLARSVGAISSMRR
ncbi:hypothetical protein Q8W40_27885 [Vibrio penaeicida]|uniref:hypothetical protein n=1 Tax=Vibrio penaeicida TaxID=104609 RepID=UPI0027368C25|nr:hypothetical protein [Vibrio penaeicida]MDP2576024.1 hypothetical protein [Vibrio penaeicida]